jgi:hypothetical protein
MRISVYMQLHCTCHQQQLLVLHGAAGRASRMLAAWLVVACHIVQGCWLQRLPSTLSVILDNYYCSSSLYYYYCY